MAIFGYGAQSRNSQLLLNELQSTSTSSGVLVYGNATVQEFNGQCGGAFYPAQVVFTSSGGTNYTSSVTQSSQGPTGNYSITLPGNDRYTVTINQKSGCSQNTTPPSCSGGTLSLGTTLTSEQVNLQCGQNPVIVSSSTTTSSTTTSTSSVNTQASSTCQTNPQG